MYIVTKTRIEPEEVYYAVLFKVECTLPFNRYRAKAIRSVDPDYTVGNSWPIAEHGIFKTFDSEAEALQWYDDYTRKYEQYLEKHNELARQMLELDTMFTKEFG